MSREVMLMWIRALLKEADDETVEYLLYFIKGYVGAGKKER